MKKTSVETVLLLSNIYSRKQILDFVRDMRSLHGAQLEVILERVEAHKLASFGSVLEEIERQLERSRVEEEERKRVERERAEKERERSGTVKEIQYLLLTRYKLKVAIAAKQLSAQLASRGYHANFVGGSSKAEFTKWLNRLCEEIPRENVMSAALKLGSE
jgi:hypothetical protein